MILADAFGAFLLDMDGVVWRGEEPVPGADRAVRELRVRGPVVFVTNNSSRTPRDCAVKLARMQIPTSPDDIVVSGHAVVEELHSRGLRPGDAVHVLGSDGLRRMLQNERFDLDRPAEASVVVVGWNRKVTYDDIRVAADLVRGGAFFLASNLDATYPAEGHLLPGTGAIVAAIEVASGVKAATTGKPQPHLFRLALQRAEVDEHEALFVGDRAETDVVGARAAGIPCALALSGVVEEGSLAHTTDRPDFIVDSVADLLEDLPQPRIERRDGALVAMAGEQELARVCVDPAPDGVVVGGLREPEGLEPRAAWYVVRRLLVDAVAGASTVRASPDLAEPLARLGVTAQVPGAEPLSLLDD